MPICFIICFIFRGFIPPPPNIPERSGWALKSVANVGARRSARGPSPVEPAHTRGS